MDYKLINSHLANITKILNQNILCGTESNPTDIEDNIMTIAYYLKNIPEDVEIELPLVNGMEIDIQKYRNNPMLLFNDIKRYQSNKNLFKDAVENKIETQMNEQLTKLNFENDLLCTNINVFKNVFVTHILDSNLNSTTEFEIECINNNVLLKLPNNTIKVDLITELPEECHAQF
jgi:hypothetical protein